MNDFKNSACYQQGMVHIGFGKLLTDPNTTIKDLADFAFEHGLDIDARLLQKMPPPSPTDTEKKE